MLYINQTKELNMEKIKIKRLDKVDAEGGRNIIAFQIVEFTISDPFNQKFTLDTKIMKDGSQLVIDGNGWIKSGYDIANL